MMRAFLLLIAATAAWGQSPQEIETRVISRVQRALELREGSVAADIGSGDSPDFSIRVLQAVGNSGKVIYVDIDATAVEKLSRKLKESGAGNARVQLGKPDDPLLGSSTLDAALIVFAYHEMTEPAAMLSRIREALRPNGRLAVIEASTEKNRSASRDTQTKEHELSPQLVESELQAAGFATQTEPLIERDGVLRYLTVARRRGP